MKQMSIRKRPFQVWKYVVSHSRLLIRSPKSQNVEGDYNIDLEFVDVDYFFIPDTSETVLLADLDPIALGASQDEIEFISTIMPDQSPCNLYVLRDEKGVKWYVGAATLVVRHNDMELGVTPIDHI